MGVALRFLAFFGALGFCCAFFVCAYCGAGAAAVAAGVLGVGCGAAMLEKLAKPNVAVTISAIIFFIKIPLMCVKTRGAVFMRVF